MQPLFSVSFYKNATAVAHLTVEDYCIIAFQGQGSFSVDFVVHSYSGNVILFLSPFQHFRWLGQHNTPVSLLRFHGDFYCIEYHKNEVACNGLLFNNIYLHPHVNVPENIYFEVLRIFEKVTSEIEQLQPFSEAVIRSYIQLILALCSKEKSKTAAPDRPDTLPGKTLSSFQKLLEAHYNTERSVEFYGEALALSPAALSKKIKSEIGKTPSILIRERVILEAKKLLHLTYKSVKEIAHELNFEDEFYFSRYFKKATGLSPLHYREKVGISIVAK